MRSQAQRDAQTVTIAAALALLIGVALVGVAVLWLLHRTSDPSVRIEQEIFLASAIAAVLVSGRYLIRHRRPDQPSDAHKAS